jgi:hypothetical protein
MEVRNALTYLYQIFKLILISAIIAASAITGETQTGWHQSAGQSLIDALKISESLT